MTLRWSGSHRLAVHAISMPVSEGHCLGMAVFCNSVVSTFTATQHFHFDFHPAWGTTGPYWILLAFNIGRTALQVLTIPSLERGRSNHIRSSGWLSYWWQWQFPGVNAEQTPKVACVTDKPHRIFFFKEASLHLFDTSGHACEAYWPLLASRCC